jgi:hypothetical protein
MASVLYLPGSKNPFYITYILVGLLLSCQPNNKSLTIHNHDDSKVNIDSLSRTDSVSKCIVTKRKLISEELNNFIPDSTINKKLILQDYESISIFYFDNKDLLTVERIRESPVVIFSDVSGKQYLLAYHYEGSTKNAFDCFEMGYFSDDSTLKGKQVFKTKINEFKTESNICLGMSFKDLISKKGENYKMDVHNKTTLITYTIKNSSFVKRHNMPGYFMKCLIKNDQVINITFGFDYP